MGDNLDKVFVELVDCASYGMHVLEWLLDNFDKDKTEIILTFFGDGRCVDKFRYECRSIYLPRCAEKKFKAEILPIAGGECETLKELITEHGMNKLVISDSCKRSISEIFEQAPNLSCKIYYVANGKLASTRYYSRGKSELIAADEETSQRKNVEKKRLSLIEQAKITEQRLRQEIDQLKQNKTSSSTSTFQEPHQATQNLIDSLKSGEGESGVSEGWLVATNENAHSTPPIYYDCED